MRYLELVEKEDKGLYVGVKFSDETIDQLIKYQEDNDIPNKVKPDKFHTTVVYSRKNIPWDKHTQLNIHIDKKSLFLEIFENDDDDTKCLVLRYKSNYLQEQFDNAMMAGATYDFDEYKPHITLSYNAGDIDIEKLSKPDIDIHIIEEYSELP